MSKTKSSYQWKKTETDANAVINTKRNPFSGSNGGISASDGLSDRLFLEAKTREKHPISELYRNTAELAKIENKIPVIVLRENESKEVLWVIEQKHLFNLIREIDLNYIEKTIPEGTTIHKLLATSSNENHSLYDVREQLTIEIKRIMRDKVISNDALDQLKSLSALSYMIDSIMDYMTDEKEEDET